ncbi:MAG TPA: formate dehydrogenase subunit alpha [Nitrospiraceae bacterium]|nr:formate dehydrogenase subunit alpha [Nitrospiraceae bacterium]
MLITINGRTIQTEPGDTIYQAARRAGISIPSLCASDHLAPFGSCRLCLCVIEGRSGTPASCTTPVQDGMLVTTAGPSLDRHRKNIVELYLSEQPEQGQQAPVLTELARSLDLHDIRYRQSERRMAYEDTSNPFFSFRNDICVSCARCVRACQEIQGTNALTMLGRGFWTIPVAGAASMSGLSEGFATSNCVSCGACVKECPTGALTEKTVLEQGPPTEFVRTTCAYCGVGCAFDAGMQDGKVVQMIPADDGPSNRGHACMKGRFGWTYTAAEDRVRTPLLREGSRWKELSWDAALDRLAHEFSRIKTTHGPDALATISSSRGTNEENYLFGKFMRCVIGTNHIDNCARVCHSATVTGMMETLGASAATNSIDDLDLAKLIMVVGANPSESHPVVGARIKEAHRRGVPMIVIDPRRTELARLADLHLQLEPGTNVALLNGMGYVIAKEGLIDHRFTAERTEGLDEWIKTVADCTPEKAEQITGVPAHLIREAARRYASSGASLCVHGLGVTEHRWGSHGVMALVNLALATGNIGKSGSGINPLRGQNNVQGASDVGCLPTYFAGYQPLDDPKLAALHQEITGRPLPTKRGMKTPDMWDAALDGRLKGLWIIGYDVAQTDPNLKKVHEALKRVEFLVVQDLFMSETTRFAHLVLPGASFLEKDGTFTNLERRIQRIRKAVDPPNGILPDWRVVCEVSNRMGYPMPYQHPSEIMDEIAQLTPMFAGVSYDRLENPGGLQWPVPSPSHPGTALMHQDTFPKGKARFIAVDYLPPGEAASEDYPFVLTTGRILQHYNCGAQTRRTDILDVVDTDVLEMHRTDMERLQLEDGAIVRLVSARGEALLPAVRSERVLPGHLFTSFHFPASTVNSLLSSSADESSKCPEYKVSAVRVEPVEREELDAEDEAELRHIRRQLIL